MTITNGRTGLRQLRALLPLVAGVFFMAGQVQAATLHMPTDCTSFSSCVSRMTSGDTLLIADGTYSDSISGVKAGTVIAAENDGKVRFSGGFNPGSAGFEMRGIVVKSSQQKSLGRNNTYRRMSFVGGPSCGNTVNTLTGANTKIYQSAFYGRGGRYLLLAYQENGGIVIEDIILRPDAGWGKGSGCSEYEPHAAYNMYDTEGFSIKGAVLIDAIAESQDSENIGGQVVNTHQNHGNVGTISQSVITTSGEYGRFASDGNGSHNLTILDSVAKGSSFQVGLSRNVAGTTTATRFDSDKPAEAWKGSLSRTTGANLVLNATFLNDPRWKAEMCEGEGVTRGVCATNQGIGTYVAEKIGLTLDTRTPIVPPGFQATSP
jgi:hypothetical protein